MKIFRRSCAIVGIACMLGVVANAQSGAPIRFEEIASKAGLRFTTQNSATPNKNQVETMVAGVGLLDYDGDGYLDVYVVNGAAIPSLRKETPAF